jgi:hypothetical protein
VEKVRSAREGALRISRNLIRCCLLWGEEATRLAALSAGLFFLGGRRSSVSQLGKGATSILSVCAANHIAAQAYRFRLEEADRTLPSRFTCTSIQSLDGAAERLLPADQRPWHQHTGTQGEEYAYFRPPRRGCVTVARNFRSPRCRGGIRSDRLALGCYLFY